jgi:hypothetical protein
MQTKVQKGDRFHMEAETFNSMLDAAAFIAGRARVPGGQMSLLTHEALTVMIKNDTATEVDRFGILCIDGCEILPEDAKPKEPQRLLLTVGGLMDTEGVEIRPTDRGADLPNELLVTVAGVQAEDETPIVPADQQAAAVFDKINSWDSRMVFTGKAPTSANLIRPAILQEPIGPGKMGWAQVMGLTPCWIQSTSSQPTSAAVIPGNTEKLAGGSGPIRVLWCEPGTAKVVAAVLLGAGGSDSTTKLAKITAKAGIAAPYVYSAEQVDHDGTTAFGTSNFTPVSGGQVMTDNLINIQEVGENAVGAGPLDIGTIVTYWPLGTRYACSRFTGRGTYH